MKNNMLPSTIQDLLDKNDWTNDMFNMHQKYGVHEWMEKNKDDKELMRKFLEFRIKFLHEELEETRNAMEMKMQKSWLMALSIYVLLLFVL